ncbi:MAG: hypothetical protein AAB462_04095, partial [Patescibacteria group bacterium]
MEQADNSLDESFDGAGSAASLETTPADAAAAAKKAKTKTPVFRFNKSAFTITGITILMIALMALGGWMLSNAARAKQAKSLDKVNNYAVTSLPLQDVKGGEQLQIGEAGHLAVNGQLKVSNTLVLSPSTAPASPTSGQIYYDKATNAPYYYNGSQFVSLAPTVIPQHVTSIGGAAGVISVGGGLQITNGQLQLSSTGVASLTSASSNVVISQDGSGNYTISSNSVVGTGAIGQIALFTGGQAIGDSILSQSGTSLLAGGSLTVTGSITSNTLQNSGPGNNLSVSAGNDSIVFTDGGRTFLFPAGGGATQTICTTGVTCVSGSGVGVILQPTAVQTDTGAGPSIFINNTGGGNIIQLQGAGGDRFVVANNGDTTIAGAVTLGSLSAGLVQSSAGGVLSSGSIDRDASPYLTGTLSVANGGTGANTFATNGIIFGNGTGALQVTTAASESVLVTDSSGIPNLAQALPTVVQSNIITTGILTTGSIASGFGTISTSNTITTTAALQGNTVNASGVGAAIQLGGIDINVSGTLSNVAYLTQNQTFTDTNTFSGAGTALVVTNDASVGNALTVGTAGATDGSLNLANALSSRLVTVQGLNPTGVGNAIIQIPSIAGGSTDVVCLLSAGNCAGSGGGATTTGGIQNYITKYNNAGGNQITNSQLFDDGSFVGVNTTTNNGQLTVLSSGAAQTALFVEAATSATAPALVVRGGPTPAAGGDLLQLQDTTGLALVTVDSSGNLTAVAGSFSGAVTTDTVQHSANGNDLNIVAGNDSIIFTDGGRTFIFPIGGGATQTICTTGISCASGGGVAVLLQPTTAQVDNGVGSSIFFNNTGGGNLLQLQGSGVDQFVVANNGDTTIAGSVTLGSLGAGIVQSSAGGLLSSSTVNRDTNPYLTGTLSVSNGGTGATTFASNGIIFGNGTGALQVTTASNNSVLVTDPSGVPSLAQTLPNAVQANITTTGTLTSGDIGAGFGTISTGNNITTAATVQGNIVNATGGGAAIQLNGTSINVAGTLSNVAYQNQANTFTLANVFSSTVDIQGAGGLTLGVAGATDGIINFANSSTTQLVSLQGLSPSGVGNATIQIPSIAGGTSDTVCLLTAGNCVGSGNSVTASGGSANYIAKFTAAQNISPSVIYDDGSFVGVNTTTNNGQLSVLSGGASQTGLYVEAAANATTPAVVIIGGVTPAVGGDLLQVKTSGGTTVVSIDSAGNLTAVDGTFNGNVSQAGSGTFSTGSGAVSLNGNTTITGSGTFSTGSGAVSFNGNTSVTGTNTLTVGTGSVTLGSLGAGIVQSSAGGLLSSSTVNRDTNPYLTGTLSVSNGGTGATTFASNGIIFGNGTGALQVTTASNNSVLVTDPSGVPSLAQTLPNAVQANITTTGTLTSGDIGAGFGTISTGNNITTAATVQGNIVNATGGGAAIQLNGTSINVAGTLSNVAYQNQANTFTLANVFSSTVDIQGAGGLTLGVAGATDGIINFANSSTTQLVSLQGLSPSGVGNATIQIPSIAGGTSDTVCLLTAGNCAGSGGGVTSPGGTSGRIAKFTGANTIADSTLSESGTVLTSSGTVVIQGADSLTVGTASSNTGSVTFNNSSNGNTLKLQSGATGSNVVLTLPTATGALGDCLQTDGTGVLSFNSCTGGAGGGVTSLDGQTGVLSLSNATGSAGTITIDDASTTQKGIAQFNSTNFTASSGTINTIQDIAITSSPTFAGLTLSTALTVANGGTGLTTFTANGIVFGNGSNSLQVTSSAANSVLVTNGSSVPSLSQTLPSAVQGNITGTGVLASGSINTGFGAISTGNNITTTAALQGATVTATGLLAGNSLDINSGSFAVNSGGVITAASGITSSGTITFTGLNSAGVVHTNGAGVLSTSAVILGTDTTGDYVQSLGSLTGLNTTGNSGVGSTPTLSVIYGSGANTSAQGDTALSFSGTGNLTGTVSGTSGGGLTVNTLDVVSNPTFTGVVSTNTLQHITAGDDLNISADNDSIIFTDGGRTFIFPAGGGATQTICTTGISCASGGGVAILLQPGSAQVDAGSGSSIFINNTGGGNLLQLQGNGSDRFVVANNGDTTIGGGLTVSSLGAGIVQSSAGGVFSSSSINRDTSPYLTGTLSVGNGGTGATTFTGDGIVFGNGTGALQVTAAAANSVLVTNGSNVPSLSQTLPTAVQGNITSTGALVSGSIASGFGTITTGNTITGTTLNGTTGINTGIGAGTQRIDSTGNLVNIGSVTTSGAISGGTTITAVGNINTTGGAFQLNGADINTSGTLNNVAYLSQANNFSAANTFSAAGTALAVTNDATIGGTLNGQTISSSANFTGTVTIQGTNSLTLGTSSSNTGSVSFRGSGGTGILTLQGPATPDV